MIRNLKINNFRNLQDLELQDLKRINILTGENNTGKTSILEAIQVLKSKNIFDNLLRISRQRGNNVYFRNRTMSIYDALVYMFDVKQCEMKSMNLVAEMTDDMKIEVKIRGQEGIGLRQNKREEDVFEDFLFEKDNNDEAYFNRYHEARFFKGYFSYKGFGYDVEENFEIDEYSSVFGRDFSEDNNMRIKYMSPIDYYIPFYSLKNLSVAIKSGDKHNLIKILREFDKDIKGIEIIVEGDRPSQYISHYNGRMMPIEVYGDGLKKILNLASIIISSRKGIVLIDEIETGIHKNALSVVIKWLIEVCKKYNVQVFLTTHSIEAIDAIIEGAKEDLDEITCYRLEAYDGRIYSNRWSGKKLFRTRKNQGLDVR